MVSANQLIWWIDAAGILHSCAVISTPPASAQAEGIYAQGHLDPATRTGTITHIHNKPASLPAIPRELFDVLDTRFPKTRWWISDHTNQKTPPASIPVIQHS